jgi:putative inorganic carbon (HCO3(-)) transporter
MQRPNAKLPFIWVAFELLPDFLFRRIHSNYVGGLLTLFLPLSFWCLVFRWRTSFVGYFVIFVVLSLGVLLTQSRGAILGIVLSLIVTGIYEHRWIGWTLLISSVGIGVLSFAIGFEWLVDIGAFAHTWDTRKELWERAIYIVQDFPITGIGMHTFSRVTDMLYPLSRVWSGDQVPHVHNLYLQVAIDVGLFGFVAFGALLGRWVWMMWETLGMTSVGTSNEALRPLVLGVWGGGIANMAYGLTDAIVLGEKAGVFFWTILGLGGALWQLVRNENVRSIHLR